MKYYNKGIAAHLIAMLELLDDDHLIFTNVQGIGPIDIVTVNIKTGEVDFYDAKSDRESRHKKRPYSEIQKKHPEDKLTGVYIDRCNSYLKDPPEEDWDGVNTLTTK